jgi:hypothetical protein
MSLLPPLGRKKPDGASTGRGNATSDSHDRCRCALSPIDEALLLLQELHNWHDDEGRSMGNALFATPYTCRSKDERQMLFNGSCSMCLRAIWSFVWSTGTADMTKQVVRGPGQCLNVCFHIGEQPLKVAPLMITGDDAARDAARAIQSDWHPDHRRACRPGRVAPSTQSARLAYEQGTCRRVDLESINYHDGDSPTTLRAGSGGTHLFAEHIGGARLSQSCHPPSHHANLPVQSRRPCSCPQEPRSTVARDAL